MLRTFAAVASDGVEELLEENFNPEDPILRKRTNVLPEEYYSILQSEILPALGFSQALDYGMSTAYQRLARLKQLIQAIPASYLAIIQALELEAASIAEQIRDRASDQRIVAYHYEDYHRDIVRLNEKFANVGRLPKMYEAVRAQLYKDFQLEASEEDSQMRKFFEEQDSKYRKMIRETPEEKRQDLIQRIAEIWKTDLTSKRELLREEDPFAKELVKDEAFEKRESDKKILDLLMRFFVHRAFKSDAPKELMQLLSGLPEDQKRKMLAECNSIAGRLHKNEPGTSVEQLLDVYHKYATARSLIRMRAIVARLKLSLGVRCGN